MSKAIKRIIPVLVATTFFIGIDPVGARAETYDWMYQPEEISQISLDLTPASRAALDAEPNEYVPAVFEITGSEGQTWGPVSTELRLKGSTSFRTLDGKAAFKLKFPKLPEGSRPWGLKKMTLNNMVQDKTKVRETLAYEVFRAMDVPASRTGYAEVDVNGESFGLYLNLETLSDQFLENWFESTAHLYEGQHPGDFRQDLISKFEVDEGDEDDISDLEQLIAAVDSPAANWESEVLPRVDLDEMIRMWATETYVGHADGYVGHNNNYYAHSDEDGVFSLLPSGTDYTFVFSIEFFIDDPGLPTEAILFNRCLAVETCRNLYISALGDVRDAVNALDIAERSAGLYELIRPNLVADPRKEHPIEESDAGIGEIPEFLTQQSAFLDLRMGDVPLAPADLAAVPAPEAIDVTWEQGETRGANPVTGYQLEYRAVGDPNMSQVPVDGATTTNRRIDGLAGGTSYEVSIRSTSDSGPGAVSELAQPVKAGSKVVVIPPDPDPVPDPVPDPPTDQERPRLKSVKWQSSSGRNHRLLVRVKLERPALKLHLTASKSKPGRARATCARCD